MNKILLAFDGSESADRAVSYVLEFARNSRRPLEVHVLNVQAPVTFGDVRKFVSQEALNAYYHDEGVKVIGSARQRLDKSSIPHHYHVGVGPVAETIVGYAREHGCDQIIMGTRGLSAISSLLVGSVATKVLHLAEIPVTCVK
jgi:nucleotide-binding universal stress UspA family protein